MRHLKSAGPLPFLWDRWERVPASAARLGLQELLDADEHRTLFMLDGSGRPPHGVSVHRSLLDATVVAALHRRVELVMTWPVNDHEALEQVRAWGVTGVISDEPAVLAELIDRRER